MQRAKQSDLNISSLQPPLPAIRRPPVPEVAQFVVVDVIIDPCGSWTTLAVWNEVGAEDTGTRDVGRVFVSPPLALPAAVLSEVQDLIVTITDDLVGRGVIGHVSIRFVTSSVGITVSRVIDCASDAYLCSR